MSGPNIANLSTKGFAGSLLLLSQELEFDGVCIFRSHKVEK